MLDPDPETAARLLTFHTACQRVSPEHVSKKLLEDALSRADQLLITTRQRAEHLAARTPSIFDPGPLNSGAKTAVQPPTRR